MTGTLAELWVAALVLLLTHFGISSTSLRPALVKALGEGIYRAFYSVLALAVFGALFGFVGLLVAVPVAAVIGVLIRFFVTEYKTGRLYRGLAPETDEARAEDAPAPTAAATDRDPSA